MDRWAYERGIEINLSCPGKPTDKAMVGSFSGPPRQGPERELVPLTQDDLQKIEARRVSYNQIRIHSALLDAP